VKKEMEKLIVCGSHGNILRDIFGDSEGNIVTNIQRRCELGKS
jgi:hypothetical protein